MLLNEREWLGFVKKVFGNFVSQSKYEVCISDLWMYIVIKSVRHFYIDSHLKMAVMILNIAVNILETEMFGLKQCHSEINLSRECYS